MKKRNKKYWVWRTTALEQSIQDGATPSVNNIIKAYERAIDNINGDIKKIFREFSRASAVDEDKAAEIISSAESNELYADLVKLLDKTEDEKLRSDIIIKINAQAYGARISRLEAIKQKIYIHLKRAQNREISEHKALHKETFQRSYCSNIYNIAKGFDVGINFSVLPEKAIEKVLSEPWLGANYSTRIWNNNEQFIERVQQTIEDGITGGHSVSRMADKLEEFVKIPDQGQRYIVERLARSETAHFMAEGQLESYKEIGIEKYQFVAAFSESTCDTCGGLDGEVVDVSQARAGENYPPIHANCRCTTVMAGFNPATRIARDPETGKNYKVDGNMNFEQWKQSLTPEQKEAFNLHVRQMKNASSDKILYEKYYQIYGKEFPKTLEEFVDMKYNDIERWDTFKSGKQDRLNQIDFENMSGLVGKLGNKEVRLWYKAHDENIINLIDKTQPLEQQARQACEMRNNNRTAARDLMKDQKLRKQLDIQYPNMPYEFYYKKYKTDKDTGKVLSDDEVNRKIIEKSTTTNKEADKKAGVDR